MGQTYFVPKIRNKLLRNDSLFRRILRHLSSMQWAQQNWMIVSEREFACRYMNLKICSEFMIKARYSLILQIIDESG